MLFSSAVYAAGIELNLFKLKHGVLEKEDADLRIQKIYMAKALVDELCRLIDEKRDLSYVSKYGGKIVGIDDGELFSKHDFRIKADVGIKKLSSAKLLFRELCSSLRYKDSKPL